MINTCWQSDPEIKREDIRTVRIKKKCHEHTEHSMKENDKYFLKLKVPKSENTLLINRKQTEILAYKIIIKHKKAAWFFSVVYNTQSKATEYLQLISWQPIATFFIFFFWFDLRCQSCEMIICFTTFYTKKKFCILLLDSTEKIIFKIKLLFK